MAMGPQHLQAAAVRAQDENAAAQQGIRRGVGLETQDLISAFDRPVATSVIDVGARTLDLMSSIDPRGTSSSNHQGTESAGLILSGSLRSWTVT
jgi:hypothetical protein